MAETHTLHVTIANVAEQLFSGEAIHAVVPGRAGEMTILPRHSAIVSPLRAGTITIKTLEGEEATFEVKGGTMEMNGNELTILI